MKHRTVGWGLLLGSPGLLAGIVLTLIFLQLPVPHNLSIALWSVAAVASAVGGLLIPNTNALKPRLLTCVAGFIFGAGIYFFAMLVADLTTDRF